MKQAQKTAQKTATANSKKTAVAKASKSQVKASDKVNVKASDNKKATAKEAAKAITESKKVIYLADGVTNGMIQKSLQDINRLHKLDAGGYMYCLKRWLHFAEATNFFAQYVNVKAEEIRQLPNLADFRTDYEKKLFAKSGKYSVWLIGQLVKRYAAQKK
jgi:hypothetical protein